MAEPIIIVKEGSLTVQVGKRNQTTGTVTTLLEVTVPGNIKFPSNSRPKGTKRDDGSWRITWKKEPPARRRRSRR